jgi:excisionase family DNA binding protein
MPITLTMQEAAKESGLSVRILYRLIGQGRLQSTTVNRRRLILANSLVELLTRGLPRATVKTVLDQVAGGAPDGGAKKKRIAK